MVQLAAFRHVALGGAVGALCRWGVLGLVAADRADEATLAINVVGSFLLGLFVGMRLTRADTQRLTHSQFLALGTGFCGALTSFSTFALQVARFLDAGEPLPALTAGLATPVLTVVLAGIGYRIGSRP
ncbi:MAG: CrcB family protein [Actinomycetota bacterium]